MATLFDIAADLRDLNEAIAQAEDAPEELKGELDAVFASMAEATHAELSQKLDNYARLMTSFQNKAELRRAEAAVYAKEAARLSGLAAADDSAVRQLKERLQTFMEVTGMDKMESNFHKFSLAKVGGKLPLIVDEGAGVPERFQRVSVDLDKNLVRAALEGGEKLEWARLGDRAKTIRIK